MSEVVLNGLFKCDGRSAENNDSEELEGWPRRQRDRSHLKQKQQNTH